jgi:hypothetical protein
MRVIQHDPYSPYHGKQYAFTTFAEAEDAAAAAYRRRLDFIWAHHGRYFVPTDYEPEAAAVPEPDGSLREALARIFGLAPDAPDEVLLSTARKAWEGVDERIEALRAGNETHARRAREEHRRASGLSDTLGDRDEEIRSLRRRLGEALVDREES